MKRNVLFLLTACAALGCTPLHAAAPTSADTSIRWADNGIELDVGAKDLSYGESLPGRNIYDTEKGWLPGIAMQGSVLTPDSRNPWTRNIYLHGEFNASAGDTHYNGFLLTTPPTPHQTTTNDAIYTFSGQVGRAFGFYGDQVMVIPLSDLGYRYWTRQITGTGGYTENYQHAEAMVGVLVQGAPITGLCFQCWAKAAPRSVLQ